MLSNAYFLAKFRFDTAENEPAKSWQNFAKTGILVAPFPRSRGARLRSAAPPSAFFRAGTVRLGGEAGPFFSQPKNLTVFSSKFCKIRASISFQFIGFIQFLQILET